MDSALSLVTTEELVEELFTRYEHVLLVYETKRRDDEWETNYAFQGGPSVAVGLGERTKNYLFSRAFQKD